MNYHWNWGVFLQESPEGGVFFWQMLVSGVGWTLAVSACAWIIAMVFGYPSVLMTLVVAERYHDNPTALGGLLAAVPAGMLLKGYEPA